MQTQFTTEQLLWRFEDRREIINLMARYSADYLLKRERDMFHSYWSSRQEFSPGHPTRGIMWDLRLWRATMPRWTSGTL